jgi:hypothetical protein
MPWGWTAWQGTDVFLLGKLGPSTHAAAFKAVAHLRQFFLDFSQALAF